MATSYLVMDIETIPDTSLYKAPDVAPGVERPFPPLYVHRPVVIGCLWLGEDYEWKRLGVIGEAQADDEARMLADFSRFVDEHRPHVVTFNGRGFDLPVIMLRCLRHGVPLRWYYQGRDYRYRYSDEGHLDLADFLTEHGAARGLSLDASARLIGLPGKVGVDGSQVEGLWNAGQREAVQSYCLSDVAQTAFLFLRFRLLMGQLDRAGYQRAARGLLDGLRADGRCGPLLEKLETGRLLLEDDPAAAPVPVPPVLPVTSPG